MMSFSRIITAAQRAEPQFSPVHGKSTDNRDVLKELALEIMRQFTALVEEAGADASYIEPYAESLVDDLEHAFRTTVEQSSTPDYASVFRPRYGLVRQLVEGARL